MFFILKFNTTNEKSLVAFRLWSLGNMQTLEDIERTYEKPDPWGFQTNPEDARRKEIILSSLKPYLPAGGLFERALDIGAGEGWITKDLPAKRKYAYEVSKQAKARLPEGVDAVERPEGNYDLVIATGVLYAHYDTDNFFRLMGTHASSIILTCNIIEWQPGERAEVKGMNLHDFCYEQFGGVQLSTRRFKYRHYMQQLRIFRVET